MIGDTAPHSAALHGGAMRRLAALDCDGAACRLHDGRRPCADRRRRRRRTVVSQRHDRRSRSPIRASTTAIRTNGTASAPWSYAVHGTDVSKYQTSIAWNDAKASRHFLRLPQGDRRRRPRRRQFRRELAARQGRRRAARRLSFLLFLPPGRGAGALVHPQCAARPFGAAAGARHGMEPAIADLQAAGPTPRRCAARCASS